MNFHLILVNELRKILIKVPVNNNWKSDNIKATLLTCLFRSGDALAIKESSLSFLSSVHVV